MKVLLLLVALLSDSVFARPSSSCPELSRLSARDWQELHGIFDTIEAKEESFPHKIASSATALYHHLGKVSNLYNIDLGSDYTSATPQAIQLVFEDLAELYWKHKSINGALAELRSGKALEIMRKHGEAAAIDLTEKIFENKIKAGLTFLMPHFAITVWAMMTLGDIELDNIALKKLDTHLCLIKMKLLDWSKEKSRSASIAELNRQVAEPVLEELKAGTCEFLLDHEACPGLLNAYSCSI